MTGIGEPVTRGSHLYLDKVGHLGIVDTQGLEVGKDNKQILAELHKAMTQMRQMPLGADPRRVVLRTRYGPPLRGGRGRLRTPA